MPSKVGKRFDGGRALIEVKLKALWMGVPNWMTPGGLNVMGAVLFSFDEGRFPRND